MLGLPAARSAFQRASNRRCAGRELDADAVQALELALSRSVAAPGAPKNDQTTVAFLLGCRDHLVPRPGVGRLSGRRRCAMTRAPMIGARSRKTARPSRPATRTSPWLHAILLVEADLHAAGGRAAGHARIA